MAGSMYVPLLCVHKYMYVHTAIHAYSSSSSSKSHMTWYSYIVTHVLWCTELYSTGIDGTC